MTNQEKSTEAPGLPTDVANQASGPAPRSLPKNFRFLLCALYILVLVGSVSMQYVVGGSTLRKVYSPGFFGSGIIAFETAPDRAHLDQLLLPSPDAKKQVLATLLPWDYVFVASYVFGLLVLCRVVGKQNFGPGWGTWSTIFSWAAIAAGFFDVLENIGMTMSLAYGASDPVPALTATVSLAKWALCTVVIGFLVAACIFHLIKLTPPCLDSWRHRQLRSVLKFKISFTLIGWAALALLLPLHPFMPIFPHGEWLRDGFCVEGLAPGVAHDIVYLRLLGTAFLALVCGYWAALCDVESSTADHSGNFALGKRAYLACIVGIVSNGLACLLLVICFLTGLLSNPANSVFMRVFLVISAGATGVIAAWLFALVTRSIVPASFEGERERVN